MIHSTQTAAIRQAADLASVMESYGVHLRRAGARLVAPCPFHQDSAPSLSVSPAKQLWKCFGCGAGGDVFTFIERIESVDFRRALQIAANHAGITITNEQPAPEQVADLRRARELATEEEYFAIHERFNLGIPHLEKTPSRIMAAFLARITTDLGYREYLRQDRRDMENLAAALAVWLRDPPPYGICRGCGARYDRAAAHWEGGHPWCSPACAAAPTPTGSLGSPACAAAPLGGPGAATTRTASIPEAPIT